MADVSYIIGDTLVFEVSVVDGDNQAINLAGASAVWGVGKIARGAVGSALFTKASGGDVSMSGSTVEMILRPGDIREPGIYEHQLRIALPNGDLVSPVLAQFRARVGPL